MKSSLFVDLKSPKCYNHENNEENKITMSCKGVRGTTKKIDGINDCLKKVTKNTKVIMPVHLYGNLFPTKNLKNKIRKSIIIIEDSAHAFCGEYHKNIIGKYSDFLVFSLSCSIYPQKGLKNVSKSTWPPFAMTSFITSFTDS